MKRHMYLNTLSPVVQPLGSRFRLKRSRLARMVFENPIARWQGVPEGQATIAQRFSVGLADIAKKVPKGRLNPNSISAVPAGLARPDVGLPTLKCWAIVRSPFGTKDCQNLPKTMRFALVFMGALIFFAHAILAQSWYTVDDFQYWPGKTAYASGLAKDSTGTIIYAAGNAMDASNVRHHLVFVSADSGTNWSVSDDYTGATDSIQINNYPSIAVDAAGNLYSSGVGWTTNGPAIWLVRSRPSAASAWVTVDLFTNAEPSGLATDSAGNVFVVGESAGASTNWVWTVRKGTPTGSGISWANVDAFSTPNTSCSASSVFCHPTAGVFVVGSSSVPYGSGSQGLWTVRRSQDGGATWTTVDTFQLTSGAWASAVGADAAGNVYVVGTASQTFLQKHRSYSSSHWIVRKCANPGASSPSWSIVDDFQFSPTYNAGARGFALDARGNVFVSGGADNPSGGQLWVTRESVGGTGTWNTVDTFQYGLEPHVIAALGDGLGNVFVAGEGLPLSGGGFHWLVRKN